MYIYTHTRTHCCKMIVSDLVFKSWTRLIAFHITLIPLGKV